MTGLRPRIRSPSDMKKICFKCDEEKELSCFYPHSGMADGRLNKCKACTKKDVSENYRQNIDHYTEYEKNRATLPHRVAARDKYQKTDSGKVTGNRAKNKWEIRNPIKKKASNTVNNAVRDGKLTKPDVCEVCNLSAIKLNGHHDDYALPLIVRWLCNKCHVAWHKINGEAPNG